MRRRSRPRAARLVAILAGAGAAVVLPASGGADPSAGGVDQLRAENARLSARSHSVVLELYAIDAQLTRVRARQSALNSRLTVLRRERATALRRLAVARRTFGASRRALAVRLRTLYMEGDVDPVAVFLGAGSLDDALARIEQLNRTARANQRVLAEARAARAMFKRLARSLERRTAAVEQLEREAAASASALANARNARSGYLTRLSSQRRLNAGKIASLEAAAAAARERSAAIAPVAVVQPGGGSESVPAPVGGRQLVVSVTGYALQGRTATGIPTGWGVVAVDPAVIPLGTRMTIPGYGQGIAADVGSSIQGAVIDIWFPTKAQALAWGRRTVTITLH